MIEQSLYQAPEGLDALLADSSEPAIEIMIENPDDVQIGVDGVTIDLMPENPEPEFDANLAEYMDESDLQSLSNDLIGAVEADMNSRKDWVDMFIKGLEVLGMKYEERTEPWSGACGVYSPLLTEAAVRFQSETIIETFPSQGPVMAKILGEETPEKKEAAARVREDMNYELTEGMPEYRAEHERMLFNLGLAGSAFKKVYEDLALGRQVSVFVPAEDVIIPYGCTGARTAERLTHIMRRSKNEVRKLQVSGFYRDVDLGEPTQIHSDVDKKKAEEQGYTVTEDDRYQILEMHVDFDMPGFEDEDGVARPYVVSIDRGTGTVLSVYRNWSEDDPFQKKKQYFVQYDYVPGFGAYGLGYIHLIGGYARAGTSIIRQLVDAGTLSNLPGGFKSRGMRIKGDDTPISPGEFRDVDVPSGAIRDNIIPLPYKEPSQTLSLLLERITEEGRRLGSIADMKVSDMSSQAPVGTTLALLERQLKTMSAVQARVHYAMKEEFKLLKALIRDHAPAEYGYDPVRGSRTAKQADYDMVDVIPVSDPNSSTMAQRIMQYQAVIQLSQTAPQIYDLPQLHRQMIEVLGIKNGEKLVPVQDDIKPKDPITENMGFLKGVPTKAFFHQDHDAHIAAHTAFLQDPMIAQTMGQNPMGQQFAAAVQAHIADHLGYQYRRKLEEQLGVPLPHPEEELPNDVEVDLSRFVAMGAQQLMQKNAAAAQQAQAQQQMQDPIIQMQMQELQIKQAEQQRKAQKDQADAQLAAQKMQTDAAIKAQQLQLQAQKQRAEEELKEQINVINAQRAGVMGRSADASILQQDREQALRLMEMMRRKNETNDLGESGGGQ
jgi:hypothetical protein